MDNRIRWWNLVELVRDPRRWLAHSMIWTGLKPNDGTPDLLGFNRGTRISRWWLHAAYPIHARGWDIDAVSSPANTDDTQSAGHK